MKLDRDLAAEDLETLQEFEEQLKDREPSLWTLTADISTGVLTLIMLIVYLKQGQKVLLTV